MRLSVKPDHRLKLTIWRPQLVERQAMNGCIIYSLAHLYPFSKSISFSMSLSYEFQPLAVGPCPVIVVRHGDSEVWSRTPARIRELPRPAHPVGKRQYPATYNGETIPPPPSPLHPQHTEHNGIQLPPQAIHEELVRH